MFLVAVLPALLLSTVTHSSAAEPWYDYYCGRSPPTPIERPVDSTLQSVQLVFRHGARTSIHDCFPKPVPYQCSTGNLFGLRSGGPILVEKFPKCRAGQLLEDRASEQFQRLANWVHESYDGWFAQETGHEIGLRSTDIERTLGSMVLLTSHLLKCGEVESCKNHHVDVEEWIGDPFAMNRFCPAAQDLEREFHLSEIAQRLASDETAERCRAQWERQIGRPFIEGSMDCLLSARCAEVPIPANTSGLFECTVDQIMAEVRAKWGFTDSDYQPKALKAAGIYAAPLLAEILYRLNYYKAGLIASHDSTLVALLQGLAGAAGGKGLWDGTWPKYAEVVAIEKRLLSSGDTVIRIVRDGKEILTVPIEDFEALAKNDECVRGFAIDYQSKAESVLFGEKQYESEF